MTSSFFMQHWNKSQESRESGSLKKKKKKVTNIIQNHLPNSLAKFRLTLEKVGTTTRPFSYDLSQIPYNHTGEVKNRFKRFDLIYRVPKEICPGGSWHCTEVRDQDDTQEKEVQTHKMVVWEGLTHSWEKKRSEKSKEKKKDIPIQMQSSIQ